MRAKKVIVGVAISAMLISSSIPVMAFSVTNGNKTFDKKWELSTTSDGGKGVLTWNGNLAIAESDVRYALIIWIKPFHQGISQGVLFNDYKDLNTQIMLSSSKKAEDQEDQWIVDENSTILTTIFEKANKVWNLGLK